MLNGGKYLLFRKKHECSLSSFQMVLGSHFEELRGEFTKADVEKIFEERNFEVDN